LKDGTDNFGQGSVILLICEDYMANSADEQLATMLANIPEKTGRSLSDWLTLIAQSDWKKHGQIVNFLKTDHGVTHGFANLIASKALDSGEEIDLVAAQYAGSKAALRRRYDEIVEFALSLGGDVEIAPKKSSVSLRRKKQFALITPATKTRIDLGLALKGERATNRLLTGNAMCSHKIKLEATTDFDTEVKAWIEEAYNRSG
jgi:hypothetical protein